MGIIQSISTGIFLVSVGLYLYYFSRRKQHDVVIHMWFTIVVGMLAGLVSQLIDVKLGKVSWSTIQLGVYLYLALIIYSLWKLFLVLKQRRH